MIKRSAIPALLTMLALVPAHAATQISSNGVTWTFAADHDTGVFVSGDPWVVGPVSIISITNSLNSPKFTPKPGQNGSMVNPKADLKQGYESGLSSYDASLNAGLPGGQPVSAGNPLVLKPGSTLISAVSWLYTSQKDSEPGTPKFNITKTPRAAVRSAGVLTVLDAPPPADSFRPPYCGSDKTIRFHASNLDLKRIPHLEPIDQSPSLASSAQNFSKPWIDHSNGWLGAYIHPTEHMPNYGRDLAGQIAQASLALMIVPEPREQNSDYRRTVIGLVQLGIDFTGIADAGGRWQADGGHGLGRKWPILFAGLLLNDRHMLDAGNWSTEFQEDQQTFYVTQETVDITNGPKWKPDKRGHPTPYTAAQIGLAEWGIRHSSRPQADNASWFATYRSVNGSVLPGFALAARLMGLKDAWKHDAFFDYCDRYMEWKDTETARANKVSPFLQSMWTSYRHIDPAAK